MPEHDNKSLIISKSKLEEEKRRKKRRGRQGRRYASSQALGGALIYDQTFPNLGVAEHNLKSHSLMRVI